MQVVLFDCLDCFLILLKVKCNTKVLLMDTICFYFVLLPYWVCLPCSTGKYSLPVLGNSAECASIKIIVTFTVGKRHCK